MNESTAILRLLAGYARLVTHSLLHRMLRASLTVVGIVIGISIVLTLVFLGNGLQKGITGQLQQFGSDLIFLLPAEAGNPLSGLTGRGRFEEEHLEAVRGVPGVLLAMPIVTAERATAVFRGEEKTVSLEPRPLEMIQEIIVESQGIDVEEGRWMASEDAREIVLGYEAARRGFREPVRVGDTIDIGSRRLEVVGLLRKFGDSTRDNAFLMTIDLYRTVTGKIPTYGGILTKVDTAYDIEEIGDDIDFALSRQRDLEEYSVLTPARSEEVISGVIGTVQSALFLIAAVAVIVAGVGVMNTMYTSVLERTREIGIMKAVGAKGWHVMLVFLMESMIIGGIGGILGILGGAALAELVAWIARARGFGFFQSSVDVATIVFVAGFTMVVGLLAGVLPARQAAKQKPVDSLRYR